MSEALEAAKAELERRFMHEAKKPTREIVQPPGGWPPMNGRGF